MSTLHVFYGTMTGNSEELAEKAVDTLREAGREVELVSLDDYEPASLSGVKEAVFFISTWGEGEPPEECAEFCEAVFAGSVPSLSHLQYTVVALGDSSYDIFCGCGIQLDEALAKAGAQAFRPRIELDIDFDDPYDEWLEGLVDALPQAA